jgi:hypothetical protein
MEMAEVLRTFDEPIRDASGSYHARVVGRRAGDGMWEGWLEFIPQDGSAVEPLVTAVESRQPEREHLAYWATGLTVIYAEGAVSRARSPIAVRTRIVETPLSAAPAVKSATVTAREPVAGPMPVLDPFAVGSRSLEVLAQELGALGRARMLNIIAGYDLNPTQEDLSWMSDAQIIRFIVTSVEAQLAHRRA